MLNTVALVGRLGADPEIRYSQSGTAFANMRMAVNDWVNNEEKTYWFNMVAFGKTAENCGQYLKKGSQVGISGKLVQRAWTDKEGRERQTVEIACNQVEFMSGNGNGNGGNGQGKSQGNRNQGNSQGAQNRQQNNQPPEPPPPIDDDIPF